MSSIVFDLDGTLIDSAPDIHRIANVVLANVGGADISLAQARNFIGNGVSVFFEKIRAERDLPDTMHDHLVKEFMLHYKNSGELTTLYPGVIATLEVLIQSGHELGICTNKPIEPCRAVLQQLKLERYFNTVWAGDSLTVRKPDPAPLHAAFEALQGGLGLYVGDSEVDAETAQRANVPFVLFTEGYRKCAVDDMPYVQKFSDFKELPSIVAELLI